MSDPVCRCGRKACDDPAPLCVLCDVFGRRVRHVDRPQGCGDCRVKLAAVPGDIADAYAWLGWALLRPESGKRGDGRSASPDPALPFPADAHDLLTDRQPPQAAAARARLAANLDDQIGHLGVAAVLHSWVRDWCDVRGLAEHGPSTYVPGMADWLRVRTDWAVDHHPAVDEYGSELHSLRGVLHALVGRPEPDERPKPITGVPCIRCRHVTLVRRHDGSVECQWPDCRRIYTADEYQTVTRAAAKAAVRIKEGAIP